MDQGSYPWEEVDSPNLRMVGARAAGEVVEFPEYSQVSPSPSPLSLFLEFMQPTTNTDEDRGGVIVRFPPRGVAGDNEVCDRCREKGLKGCHRPPASVKRRKCEACSQSTMSCSFFRESLLFNSEVVLVGADPSNSPGSRIEEREEEEVELGGRRGSGAESIVDVEVVEGPEVGECAEGGAGRIGPGRGEDGGG
jgi:hypothetical protein